jgi:hypothetical protein
VANSQQAKRQRILSLALSANRAHAQALSLPRSHDLRNRPLNRQLPAFIESLPIDPLVVAANYFSLDCLQITFKLLRDKQPCLALEIQNCIVEARFEHSHNPQDKRVALHMGLQQVSNIVTALSAIAESAASDSSYCKASIASIHQTLLDWLLYAQSFLVET